MPTVLSIDNTMEAQLLGNIDKSEISEKNPRMTGSEVEGPGGRKMSQVMGAGDSAAASNPSMQTKTDDGGSVSGSIKSVVQLKIEQLVEEAKKEEGPTQDTTAEPN